MKTYIALDLETTGFEPLNDQVIEIAAIKFENDKIVDTFDTLINPGIPVPQMVTQITGIKDEDLTESPSFSDKREELRKFIGDCPIIGHNIGFDISFLNQKGMQLQNPLFDTLQMAGVLLPGLASYSLDTLSRTLKIVHEKKHRAYSDANACYQLFIMLREKIKEIDPTTYEEILAIISKSDWPLKEFFLGTKPDSKLAENKKKKIEKIANEESSEHKSPEESEIRDFFSDKSPLLKVIKDYEIRDSQKQMSGIILDSFKENRSFIIEAGTGTGKTLAYLLPSAYFSTSEKEKVVISTYTHTLQEQIMGKDLPLLEEACLGLSQPMKFKSAVLKGRKNYISMKRFENFIAKDFFLDHEVTLIIKIILWINKTETGDLEELSIQGKEFTLLDEICCAQYVCDHENADYANGCYMMKASKKAGKADIVIINHALLIQNALAENKLLPEYSRLIIDEAHHMEKVATDSLTVSITFGNFIRPFEKLQNALSKNFADTTPKKTKELITTIDKIISRIEIFFGLIGIFMEKNLGERQFQYHLMLLERHLQSDEWQKIMAGGKQIIEQSQKALDELKEINEGKTEKIMLNLGHECEKRLSDLQHVTGENITENVLWILKTYEGNVSLKSAPANIGPAINDLLFKDKKSIILTSGTLRTDHSFTFIRDQLQLGEQFEEQYFKSHFDFPDQVKVLLPQDLPEPATEGYFKNCAELIGDVIRKNGGRTLVLFTSKSSLMATYRLLAPKLKDDGFAILAQNVTGGRGKIIEHFKDEPGKSAIFGTASFWEGVDIKGNSLNCIIMYKLPFDPPDDPIILTRNKMYENSFAQYQLPRAILKFKQGFGRLIRSSKDTGSIIILDPRIVKKSYGQQFIQSLPEGIKIEYTSKDNLTELL